VLIIQFKNWRVFLAISFSFCAGCAVDKDASYRPPFQGIIGHTFALNQPMILTRSYGYLFGNNVSLSLSLRINRDSGPGGAGPNADYQHGMADLAAGGVKMIGYVATGYGTRSLSSIESDIELWSSSFPEVSGIFLNEESKNPAELSFYQTIYDYVLTKSELKTVIANPGTNTPESFISALTANTTMLFESGTGWESYATDGYVANYSRSRFAASFYDLSTTAEMESAVNLAQERNFGYVFATDGTGANPYDALPSYWNEEVSYVASVPEPSTMVLAGLGVLWLAWWRQRRRLTGIWR